MLGDIGGIEMILEVILGRILEEGRGMLGCFWFEMLWEVGRRRDEKEEEDELMATVTEYQSASIDLQPHHPHLSIHPPIHPSGTVSFLSLL